ncbi:hypothetical protein [Aeromonas finlandensis]|uniref:hypothetical protein n=1 Tax=Aeromonas finlandensis TaxID=1543375 RepID=UPI00051B9B86|nr:hypothetical protein [Aeromonas finlandensis]
MKKEVYVLTGYPQIVENSGPVSYEWRSVQVDKLQGKLLDYAVAYVADGISNIEVTFDICLRGIESVIVTIGDKRKEWNPTNNMKQAKTVIPELVDDSDDVVNKLRQFVRLVIGTEFEFEVPVQNS